LVPRFIGKNFRARKFLAEPHATLNGATVSRSQSSALVLKPSLRGFTHTLLLGGLIAMAAMTMQNARLNSQLRIEQIQRPVLMPMAQEPVAKLPSVFDEEAKLSPAQLLARWDDEISQASRRFGVPKSWIRAVMRQESGGRTMMAEGQPIVSRAGAIGLMQVMPDTYSEMAAEHGLGADPFNARDNIMAGTAYLRWLHKKYGNPRMFAAYNAGPGRVEKGGKLPAETRAYVGSITKALGLRADKGPSRLDLVTLTRPNGAVLKIEASKVTAIRAVLPGEYADGVKSVVTIGSRHQAVQEDVIVATAAIRATGGTI
jgi:soluble lytic murein transglycosylase-like protein